MRDEEEIDEGQIERLQTNFEKNIESIVRENPDIEFKFFYTPYSIAYWDSLYRNGQINRTIRLTEEATKRLINYDNVELFCFFTNYDMICDLDNYVDKGHYCAKVNSKMLQWMADDEYVWTRENYQEKLLEMQDFYMSYDYDELWR